MKYRLKFTKGELVKYIPHLDMLRLYQRAIRRANLPIAYSQGFNPHQQMSFAQPISVGITSVSDYIDIETVCDVDTNDFIKKLNDCLPNGTCVLDMRSINQDEKNGMAAVEGASYHIILDKDITQDMIDRFLLEEELIIFKKSKKSTKYVNIREDIFELYIDKTQLYTLIATGSTKNLKPDLLIECLYNYLDLEYEPYKIKYERQDLFKLKGGHFVSLFKL